MKSWKECIKKDLGYGLRTEGCIQSEKKTRAN